jgi:hypothetical protein
VVTRLNGQGCKHYKRRNRGSVYPEPERTAVTRQ